MVGLVSPDFSHVSLSPFHRLPLRYPPGGRVPSRLSQYTLYVINFGGWNSTNPYFYMLKNIPGSFVASPQPKLAPPSSPVRHQTTTTHKLMCRPWAHVMYPRSTPNQFLGAPSSNRRILKSTYASLPLHPYALAISSTLDPGAPSLADLVRGSASEVMSCPGHYSSRILCTRSTSTGAHPRPSNLLPSPLRPLQHSRVVESLSPTALSNSLLPLSSDDPLPTFVSPPTRLISM